MSKQTLVSGIKPTGRLHFGNYFGAMKQNIDLSNSGEYESYVFIADYHALTTVRNGDELRQQTIEAVASYIACGLDVSKVVLFKQSSVPQVTELTWIFNNLVTMPYMMRAHAFKSRVMKNKDMIREYLDKNIYFDRSTYDNVFNINFNLDTSYNLKDNLLFNNDVFNNLNSNEISLFNSKQQTLLSVVQDINEKINSNIGIGLFDYPVLMASDILIYGADIVPVGADQKQHVEYARDIAGYYNRAYNNEEFKLPKDLIVESVASLPGIDGQKMSKSYNNHIELFCSDDDLKKRVMSIVTDSASPEDKKSPDENNIYKIHKLFLNEEEDKNLRAKFENGGYGYKQAKDELLVTIMKWREGKKEKYDELLTDTSFINSLMKEGGDTAQQKAKEKMSIIRKQVGLE